MLKEACLTKLVFRNRDNLVMTVWGRVIGVYPLLASYNHLRIIACVKQFFYNLESFCNKDIVFLAVLLHFKTADVFLLILGDHCWCLLIFQVQSYCKKY